MENPIPTQAQQQILSLQFDLQYFQRRAAEAQQNISAILNQLKLESVQIAVLPPAPVVQPDPGTRAPLKLAPKEVLAVPAPVEEIPPTDAPRVPEGQPVPEGLA